MEARIDELWLEESEQESERDDRVAPPSFHNGRTRSIFLGAMLVVSLGCGVAVGCMIDHAGNVPAAGQVTDDSLQSDPGDAGQIKVDVRGDVVHPGVYSLTGDARVQDAVKAAGGYLHSADRANVNEALPLDDGAEVVIPPPNQSAVVSASGPEDQVAGMHPASASLKGRTNSPTGASTMKFNLNTASVATLETITGIGPKRAQAIVQYRMQHGPYRNTQDLLNVQGIGPVLLSRMVPYLFVEDGYSGHKS